jgi:hypothetical protein
MTDHARARAFVEAWYATPDDQPPGVWEAFEALLAESQASPPFRFALGARVTYGAQPWRIILRRYTEYQEDATRLTWHEYGLVDLLAPPSLNDPMLWVQEEWLSAHLPHEEPQL